MNKVKQLTNTAINDLMIHNYWYLKLYKNTVNYRYDPIIRRIMMANHALNNAPKELRNNMQFKTDIIIEEHKKGTLSSNNKLKNYNLYDINFNYYYININNGGYKFLVNSHIQEIYNRRLLIEYLINYGYDPKILAPGIFNYYTLFAVNKNEVQQWYHSF